MGIEIQDGRGVFYQWDTGRKLAVDDGAEQVHFQNREHGTTIDVDVVDGVAAVPDVLLQAARPLRVFAYIEEEGGCYTKLERVFEVTERNKPAGYVYTPTEARNFSQLQKQIGTLADLETGQLYKQFYDFTLETGRNYTYNSGNVELKDFSRAGELVPMLCSYVQQIVQLFESIDFVNDAGKLVGISADGFVTVDPATLKS